MWTYDNGYSELYHHGIKDQKWGQRRFQYEDGSLTPAGKERYYHKYNANGDKVTNTRRKAIADEMEQNPNLSKKQATKKIDEYVSNYDYGDFYTNRMMGHKYFMETPIKNILRKPIQEMNVKDRFVWDVYSYAWNGRAGYIPLSRINTKMKIEDDVLEEKLKNKKEI